jgi:hypothetical protein
MKATMNRFLIFTNLLFLLTLNVQANEKYFLIHANPELPAEVSLVLEELQKIPLSQPDFDLLKSQIELIDIYARPLSKEEIFFVIKSHFYKELLISVKQITKYNLDSQSIKNLNDAATNTSDPFLKWFLAALQKDAQMIQDLPLYHDYIIAKNLGKIENIELRKIDKKVQLISSWIARVSIETPDLLLKDINPILQEILKKIERSFYHISLLSKTSSTQKPDSPLMYFNIEQVIQSKGPLNSPKQEKTVKDIIDSTEPLPAPSNEDWLSN